MQDEYGALDSTGQVYTTNTFLLESGERLIEAKVQQCVCVIVYGWGNYCSVWLSIFDYPFIGMLQYVWSAEWDPRQCDRGVPCTNRQLSTGPMVGISLRCNSNFIIIISSSFIHSFINTWMQVQDWPSTLPSTISSVPTCWDPATEALVLGPSIRPLDDPTAALYPS